MSSILIYHHLGLGDHFMCHGIVREYARRFDRVGLFVKPHNYPSVSFMYRDLKNIRLYRGSDMYARWFIRGNRVTFGSYHFDTVKIIGHHYLDRNSGEQLERQFYRLAEVPIEAKWDNFYVERDTTAEGVLYKTMVPLNSENYAFVHDEPARGYGIDAQRIGSVQFCIRPEKGRTSNVFDYCGIIERAREIHVIDSSFMFLVDCLPYDSSHQKLYVHRYARPNPLWQLPILKKSWIILT